MLLARMVILFPKNRDNYMNFDILQPDAILYLRRFLKNILAAFLVYKLMESGKSKNNAAQRFVCFDDLHLSQHFSVMSVQFPVFLQWLIQRWFTAPRFKISYQNTIIWSQ